MCLVFQLCKGYYSVKLSKEHVEKRHFATPDTGSYDLFTHILIVIQNQEAYRKQTVAYHKGIIMKRVQFYHIKCICIR
jgi:hypothetical protein